jgi:predicted nucleic acid-binding protein
MSLIVIDASIAVKWVVQEEGTTEALALRGGNKLIAPDLLVSECADVLWKKVIRGELERQEAMLAARLLSAADIELLGTRGLLETAARLAIQLNHPAYDCTYLALAIGQDCRFVTADERFIRKVQGIGTPEMREFVLLLRQMRTRAPKRRSRRKGGEQA